MAKTGSISFTQGQQSGNSTYIEVRGIITTSGESYRGSHRTGTYSVTQDNVEIASGNFTSAAPLNSTTELFAVGLWVNHKSDGTSGTISASYNYDSGWCTASGSTTLSSIVFWTNINVLNPDDIEISTNGAYFDVNWLDGDRWTNLTNEPVNPAIYKPYGAYMELYNIRPFTGYKLEKVTGATPHVNNPNVYCKTITDSSEINIHLEYQTYLLTIDSNGGKLPDGTTIKSFTSPYMYYNSANYQYLGDFIPTRDNYEFLGYYDLNDEQVYYVDGWCIGGTYWSADKGVYQYVGDLTVYAHWQPNTYTITFNGNGGNTVINSVEIAYETEQSNDISQYIPTRQAYEFLGWYTSPTGGVQVYDANGLCTNNGTYWLNDVCVYTEDYTLYAQWKALNLAYYKLNGEWLRCYSYIKVNGVWYAAIYKRNFNGDYDFEIAVLLDEEGNTLTDENGNVLVIIE